METVALVLGLCGGGAVVLVLVLCRAAGRAERAAELAWQRKQEAKKKTDAA